MIGKTPLFRARTYETAMFLLQKGADFTIRAKLYIEDVKELNESKEGNNIIKEEADESQMIELRERREDIHMLEITETAQMVETDNTAVVGGTKIVDSVKKK